MSLEPDDYIGASLETLLNDDGFKLEFSYTVLPGTADAKEVFVLSRNSQIFEWANDGLGALNLYWDIPPQSELEGWVNDWEYVQERYRELSRELRGV